MAKAYDIIAEFHGLTVLHQKIPGQEVGRHQHSEHEFFLPLQGELVVQHEQNVIKAGPGRMLYVPPDIDHSFSSSAQGSGERVIWLIDPKVWRKHVRSKFPPSVFATNALAKELVFYLLIHRKAPGTQYFVSALIESLSDSLQAIQLKMRSLASGHISGRVVEPRIVKVLEIMETELGSLSLAQVARLSGLSLRNFNRLFLKETGLGPKDYLILRRVEKAKALLKETKMTVTDISLAVGYNSLSKFIATFKKITGLLPSDYRAGGL